MTPADFNAWVAHMRKTQGWNQRDCAKALGVQEIQVGRWMRTERRQLARYIGLACAAVIAELAPWSAGKARER